MKLLLILIPVIVVVVACGPDDKLRTYTPGHRVEMETGPPPASASLIISLHDIQVPPSIRLFDTPPNTPTPTATPIPPTPTPEPVYVAPEPAYIEPEPVYEEPQAYSGGGVEQWRGLVASIFPAWAVDIVLAIMNCESGGNPNTTGGAGELGLMQIHPGYHADATYEPYGNLMAAYRISGGGAYWTAWTCARMLGY